ncbi:MAG: HlyC/CorC family transporter [Lachnospiraceae bacterium]|nr:HlyC/CorC family transporter [Lachnospiraceae bacterium]
MDDGAGPQIGLIILLLLVVLHVVLYGFLAALSGLNGSNLEKQAKEGDKNASLLRRLWKKPAGSVHNLQFFVTGFHLFAGAYVIAGYKEPVKLILLLVYWAVLLMIGVYAPAKIGGAKAEAWGFGLCRLMSVLMVVGFPFVRCLELTADLVVRIFGVDPGGNSGDLTEEEIMSVVNEGHEQGVLLASEAEMIHNIFEFGDKEAKDIMTHRKNILALDGTATFAEAMEYMKERGNSRFPVYIDDIDNIIGVLHIKEALKYCTSQDYYSQPIREMKDLIWSVDFIPETRNISALFKEMQAKKTQMAVVVDEYGQTAGIVAMEDILEEIVGNILDEHDEYEEMILKQPDGSFLMDGMADFEDVIRSLSVSVEEDDSYETLNGFLISRIDKIPDEDDRISVEAYGYCFKILSVENKMIKKVSAAKLLHFTPTPVAPLTGDGPIRKATQNF